MAKTYVKPKEMTELVNTPSWMDKGLGSQNEMKEEERRSIQMHIYGGAVPGVGNIENKTVPPARCSRPVEEGDVQTVTNPRGKCRNGSEYGKLGLFLPS